MKLSCPHNLKAYINPRLFEQAVVNLIDNAVKYSEKNKIIRVEAESEGSSIKIHVIDQGNGIEEDHIPRLFERFYRAERNPAVMGTGLGLAIVKHIVLVHNGSIEVESTINKGSTFTILLPNIH
jgi:two-component system phosphate regulon sensor histidine kinase PhoR